MAPTLVCSMFGFSGAALVTQAGYLVSWLWDFLQHQYKKQPITISNTKPDLEPPPTWRIQGPSVSGLICLKLAIWTLNWLMGMFGADASFFKFSTSGLVTLDWSKCVQTLKFDGVNVGIWRFADFQCNMEAFWILFKARWKFDSRGECTVHWLQVNECDWGLKSFNMAVVFTLDFQFNGCLNRNSPVALV